MLTIFRKLFPRKGDISKKEILYVGSTIKILWPNGHGFTVFEIAEYFLDAEWKVTLKPLLHYEVNSNGEYTRVD